MPTVVPFHRAVLDDPAFTAADGHFGVHTRWIETEFTGQIAPYDGPVGEAAEPTERSKVVVEVNGKRLEVMVPAGLGAANGRIRRRGHGEERRSGGGAAQATRRRRATP